MFQECRHILTSGFKCKAPALGGQVFCYFHTKAHHYRQARVDALNPLPIPAIEDTAGIQIAVNQVIRQLSLNRLDQRKASTLLYGLQLSSRLAKNPTPKHYETVRKLSQIPPSLDCPEAIELAPEKSACEPPDDCVHCDSRDFCRDFGRWEDQVEELEERLEAEHEDREQTEPDDEDDDENQDEVEEDDEDDEENQGESEEEDEDE
jgi:hypothetical protein